MKNVCKLNKKSQKPMFIWFIKIKIKRKWKNKELTSTTEIDIYEIYE